MKSFVIYGGEKVEFEVPAGWNVLYGSEIAPAPACADPVSEVRRALDAPVGSPPIEELAKGASRAVVLFDDLTRPTPAQIAFPEVLDRLNRGGIPDSRIAAVCAVGTHPAPDTDGLKRKMGAEAYGRLAPRVHNHDARSRENVPIGRTSRGALVEINPYVAAADLVIGIGACFPHSWAGFGGGSKIVMPGVCGIASIAAHHLTWLRNSQTHSGVTKGNWFHEEANEIARMANLGFKIDLLLNFRGEVTRVFAGDVVAEHGEAIRECEATVGVSVSRKADVTISAAFPLERGNQCIKSLSTAAAVTKAGGQIIWVAPQPDRDQLLPFVNEVGSAEGANAFHRRLIEGDYPEALIPIGLSFMCTVVEVKGFLERFSRIIHVTEGLDRSHVEFMKMTFASSIEEAVAIAARETPRGDAIVFPYGGVVLPRIGTSGA
jgi:nickel-dependent lactate racemase